MTVAPGRRNDLTDVPGLAVGSAEDARLATGVTVIVPDRAATCGVVVAGGAPGTRETDAMAPGALVGAADVIVLSGGSVYGLSAADRVTALMGAAGRGFRLAHRPGAPLTPVVPAAILYDLAVGPAKDWGESPPFPALAARALEATEARDPVALGSQGAGAGAMAGGFKGGQGSASIRIAPGLTVAALVACNAFGSVTLPGQRAFWAWAHEIGDEAGAVMPDPARRAAADDWGESKLSAEAVLGRTNTSLAVVATNAPLSHAQAQRLAGMATAGLARAIRPVFAPFDGDVVFALTTADREAPPVDARRLAVIGAAAADCVARAVMRAVAHAEQGLPEGHGFRLWSRNA
jgi:L-aminopeptidase/D-esterase-like protein